MKAWNDEIERLAAFMATANGSEAPKDFMRDAACFIAGERHFGRMDHLDPDAPRRAIEEKKHPRKAGAGPAFTKEQLAAEKAKLDALKATEPKAEIEKPAGRFIGLEAKEAEAKAAAERDARRTTEHA